MEKLKEFINNFIETEFKCNRGKFDVKIHDSTFGKMRKDTNSFFIESISDLYNRSDILEKKKNPMYAQMYIQNLKNTRKRILFQIKKFEKPILGDGLKKVVKGDSIYRADMSYDLQTPAEFSKFSRGYYIANTDNGLKIIYFKRFDIKNGIWEHQHDWKPSQVLEEGNLIAVEKLQAPIEPNSLKEYNKD